MEGLVLLESIGIEEARLACFVRHVETDSPVETDDEEIEVVTDTNTCADSHLAEEILQTEAS